MKRRNAFARGLLFAIGAAIAALLAPAFALGSLALHVLLLAGLVPAYLLVIAPDLRRGLGVSLTLLLVSGLLWAIGTPPAQLATLQLLALGIVRSGVFYPGGKLRAVLIEGSLIGTGIAFAGFLVGTRPSWMSVDIALAVWGFFLVQSSFALIGARTEVTPGQQRDPFDEANARATAVLEELGG